MEQPSVQVEEPQLGKLIELPTIAARRDRQYLPTIPERLFCALVPLPGKALAVYMVLRLRSRLSGRRSVSLTSTLLARFGIDKNQKARALACLEEAGLIVIRRQNGKNPVVTLLAEETL
jgi:DNA-binding transcriptional ArsR family regulator